MTGSDSVHARMHMHAQGLRSACTGTHGHLHAHMCVRDRRCVSTHTCIRARVDKNTAPAQCSGGPGHVTTSCLLQSRRHPSPLPTTLPSPLPTTLPSPLPQHCPPGLHYAKSSLNPNALTALVLVGVFLKITLPAQINRRPPFAKTGCADFQALLFSYSTPICRRNARCSMNDALTSL